MTTPWHLNDFKTYTLYIGDKAIVELHGHKEDLARMLSDHKECAKLGIPEEYMFERYELILKI